MSLSAQIVDETDDLIIINKPPFLLVHPTKPRGPITLWDRLNDLLSYELVNGGQIALINRLDRETSGLLLVTKNKKTARACSMAMAQGAIHKEYLALLYGWLTPDEGTVDQPLLRKGSVEPSKIWLMRGIHPKGAVAQTDFRVEQRITHPVHGPITVVRCWPRTGRTHQIRVHMASLGHPIIGDKIYGPSEDCYLTFIKKGWSSELNDQLWLPRHALHSTALGLEFEGQKYRWDSPLPDDLAEFVCPFSLNGQGAQAPGLEATGCRDFV
ncbi:MAG: RluA family pseudouridine synthase [Chthoniobacterales bacterium]